MKADNVIGKILIMIKENFDSSRNFFFSGFINLFSEPVQPVIKVLVYIIVSVVPFHTIQKRIFLRV